jgi:hypothetical protein
MIFNPSQADVRRFFCDVWNKMQQRLPLEPLQAMAADWIAEHPQYHAELESMDDALARDYPVEGGQTNPFLHLSMHLAIAEQLSIDQPPGIRGAYETLSRRLDSPHEAAHQVMECLGETLWRAQRDRQPPDGAAYIGSVLQRANR